MGGNARNEARLRTIRLIESIRFIDNSVKDKCEKIRIAEERDLSGAERNQTISSNGRLRSGRSSRNISRLKSCKIRSPNLE